MKTWTADHPWVRASCTCPLCQDFKDGNLVTCWRCYNVYGLRYGNPAAEALIDEAEDTLRASV